MITYLRVLFSLEYLDEFGVRECKQDPYVHDVYPFPLPRALFTELDELPKYELPAEAAAPITLKEKIITCLCVALNTFSTLGLIFFSKLYGIPPRALAQTPRHGGDG